MQYVTRAFLSIDGKEVADIKTVAELEAEIASEVQLMHGSGYADKTERYGVEVGYVVPAGAEFNWRTVREGTLVIEKDGGDRVLFTGVRTLKLGRRDFDNDKELVQTITLMATKRTEQ